MQLAVVAAGFPEADRRGDRWRRKRKGGLE
jgi:hypothetical protein